MSSNFPAQVLLVRHGEKLGDPSSDDGISSDLSVRGASRAAAIPSLFCSTQTLSCSLSQGSSSFSGQFSSSGTGTAPRFPTPNFIFATQKSHHSNRPVETITPLATALNLKINDKHSDDEYGDVANDILQHPKYAGQVVLVCWHHGKLQDLAQSLGVKNAQKWPGTVFDRVWQITYPNGVASLVDAPQMLLYGDSSE